MKTLKFIHYCWFGRNPLPELVIRCIESWKKFCPDYQIIEWNEDNFDINCCKYVQEAYNAKKWAFVSDVCRFWVLYNYGGIYLDTDVELIKPLDELPDNFVGFEKVGVVNSGLIRGAEKGNSICKEMYDSYLEDSFVKPSGEFNYKTVCMRETDILVKKGLVKSNKKQEISGTAVFPVEYFNPVDYLTGKTKITKNTYSIHHYNASWHDEQSKYGIKLTKKLSKFLPKKLSVYFANFITMWKFSGFKFAIKKVICKIKRK